MNDQLAERIAIALEQIALELGTQGDAFRAVASQRAQQPAPAPQAQAAPQRFQPIGWACPIHNTSKVVPAGVSQRTGNPYQAFVACAVQGCNEKPPRVQQQAPARAMPPSEGVQPGQLP